MDATIITTNVISIILIAMFLYQRNKFKRLESAFIHSLRIVTLNQLACYRFYLAIGEFTPSNFVHLVLDICIHDDLKAETIAKCGINVDEIDPSIEISDYIRKMISFYANQLQTSKE